MGRSGGGGASLGGNSLLLGSFLEAPPCPASSPDGAGGGVQVSG